jgi:hypothetical protein
MHEARIWLPIIFVIVGFAAWIGRGWSSLSAATEDDEPDHNHGSRL